MLCYILHNVFAPIELGWLSSSPTLELKSPVLVFEVHSGPPRMEGVGC